MIETMRATSERRPPETSGVPRPAAAEGVRTTVEDGVVVLVGTVPDMASWAVARDAALRTPRTAIADLTVLPRVRPCLHPEQAKAVARAVQATITRTGIDASVLVHCDGAIATLWGRAATRQDRAIATAAAWSVPGIDSVQNWVLEDC